MRLIYKVAGAAGTGLKDKKGTTVREGYRRWRASSLNFARRVKNRSEDRLRRNGPRQGQEKEKAHSWDAKSGPARNERRLEIPEGGVGSIESEADVPRFVITPDDLCFGGATRFGMDEFYALAKREWSADDGHAAGVADVHGDAVGTLAFCAFLPFDLKTHLRNDALVSSHSGPAVFHIFFDRTCNYCCCCHGLPRCASRGVPGRGKA